MHGREKQGEMVGCKESAVKRSIEKATAFTTSKFSIFFIRICSSPTSQIELKADLSDISQREFQYLKRTDYRSKNSRARIAMAKI